jgi:dephospho-CoA kinase
MKWIGLTGGIATGKSSVSRILQAAQSPVIDADQVAREVVAPGTTGLQQIEKEFGASMLLPDQSLDRKALGQITFSDPIARKKLESILHPLIQARTKVLREELERAGHSYAIYDIPLLFETRAQSQFDAVAVVSCRPEQQRERLRTRNNLTEQEINDRLAAQLPLRDKVAKADFVIDNSGDLSHLQSEVERFLTWLSVPQR